MDIIITATAASCLLLLDTLFVVDTLQPPAFYSNMSSMPEVPGAKASPVTRSAARKSYKNSTNSSVSSSSTNRSNKRRGSPLALPTQKNKKKLAKLTQKPPPAVQKPRVVKKESKRPTNFSKEEDLMLAKAFVNATEDPIKGAGSKQKLFWAQVKKGFDTLCLSELEISQQRTQESLKNRWLRHISKEVQYFNKYYKQIKEKNPSGKTEQNMIEDSMELYLEMEGRPFKFSWEVVETLHKLPKFNPFHEEEEEDDDADVASSSKKASSTNEVGKAMGQSLERPIGRERAKKLLKEAPTLASIETERNQQVASLAAASMEIANAIRQKEESDTTIKMISMYRSMGMIDEAKQLMSQLAQDRVAAKAKRLAAATPVSQLTQPPVNSVHIPAVDNGSPPTPELNRMHMLNQTQPVLPEEEEAASSTSSGHKMTAAEKKSYEQCVHSDGGDSYAAPEEEESFHQPAVHDTVVDEATGEGVVGV